MKMNNSIVIDNFLDNPYLVRVKGLLTKYYDRYNHPDPSAINQFPGIRSLDLKNNNLRKKSFHKITKYFIENNINERPIFSVNSFRLNYSLTFSDTLYGYHYDSFVESDNVDDNRNIDFKNILKRYAGVIYLNPFVDSSYGTSIITGDGKYEIGNKFNRLVLYPTTTYHSLSGSFGNNKFNSRMVITVYMEVDK